MAYVLLGRWVAARRHHRLTSLGAGSGVVSVQVSPAAPTVTAGSTVPLTATAYDAGGHVVVDTVTWTSDTPAVATVDSTGLVTGVAAGSATITATVQGISGTASVSVQAATQVVTTVTVSPATASFSVGSTQQYTATAKDQNGVVMSGVPFAWTSSDTGVATVDSTGLVTGVAQGAATITATASGVSGTASATVTAAAGATTFFAAPTGTATGAGTQADPWDLATALGGGPGGTVVQPGDIIFLRGGTYGTGVETVTSTLTGALAGGIDDPTGKVQVCQYPGEQAVLDGFFVHSGSYTWFREFRITCSQASPPNTHAVSEEGPGNKYLDLVVDNSGGNAFAAFSAATDTEFFGNIAPFSGRQTATGGFAHSFYIQNTAPSVKRLRGNIGYLGFAFGLHGYADAGALDNLVADHNIFFRYRDIGGVTAHIGGASAVTGAQVTNNLFLEADGGTTFEMGLTYNFGDTVDAAITDNVISGEVDLYDFVSGSFQRNTLLRSATFTVKVVDYVTGGMDPVTWDTNTYQNDQRPDIAFIRYTGDTIRMEDVFSVWQTDSGKDAASTFSSAVPSGTYIRTIAHPYPRAFGGGEVPVGVIGILQFNGAGSVAVDLATAGLAVGDSYKVYHVFDLTTAVASGTYAGGTVAIPVAAKTPPTPVSNPSGSTLPATIGPEESAFRVVKL